MSTLYFRFRYVLRPRTEFEAAIYHGLPTPSYNRQRKIFEPVNEVTIHLPVIASRGFWLIQRRPHECSSQIGRAAAPLARKFACRQSSAINCFEDEVSPRIRKDDSPRTRFKDDSPSFSSIYPSQWTTGAAIRAGDIESALMVEVHGICEKRIAKICLRTIL